jgi:hypothetical protein
MKKELAKASEIQLKNKKKDPVGYERRKEQVRLMILLDIDPYYTDSTVSNNSVINTKFYKTYSDYERDKVIARLLIEDNKELPKELYEKLLYTKQELESRSKGE